QQIVLAKHLAGGDVDIKAVDANEEAEVVLTGIDPFQLSPKQRTRPLDRLRREPAPRPWREDQPRRAASGGHRHVEVVVVQVGFVELRNEPIAVDSLGWVLNKPLGSDDEF